MQSPFELPLELWELIISFCATPPAFSYPSPRFYDCDIHPDIVENASHHETLLACALTCKAWLPQALRCLYRGVILSFHPSYQQDKLVWLQYIAESTGLRHLQLPLRFEFPTTGMEPLDRSRSGSDPGFPHIKIDDSCVDDHREENSTHPCLDLGAISVILPHLFHHQQSSTDRNLNTVATVSLISWRTYVCARAVQDLRLMNINITSLSSLTRMLCSFPSIRHLDLYDVHITNIDDTNPCYSPQIPLPNNFEVTRSVSTLKLYSLECHIGYRVLERLMGWLLATGALKDTLRYASIEDDGDWSPQEPGPRENLAKWVGNIVLQAGSALRSFTLLYMLKTPIILDFKTNTSLETLVLYHMRPTSVVNFLSTINSAHFHTLTLHTLPIDSPTDVDMVVDSITNLAHRRLPLESVDIDMFNGKRWTMIVTGTQAGDITIEDREVAIARMARLKNVLGEKLTFRYI